MCSGKDVPHDDGRKEKGEVRKGVFRRELCTEKARGVSVSDLPSLLLSTTCPSLILDRTETQPMQWMQRLDVASVN